MFCIAPLGFRLGPHVDTGENDDVTYNELLDAIVSILASVDGIGNVYKYPQRSTYIETHKELFLTDDKKFHVWWPKRIGWNASGGIGGQVLRQHIFRLFGYRSFKDTVNEEETFQELLDRIAENFDTRANLSLGGTIAEHLPLTLVESDFDNFGGVFCHKAVFEFIAYT